MNSVPYAFCDAVASALNRIPPLGRTKFAKRSRWKRAFADHFKNRMNLNLQVLFEDGKWSYKVTRLLIPFDLQEVLRAHRKYIRLEDLLFGTGTRSASSLDEIRSILKFLRPCADASGWLELCRIDAPKEVIVDLLSPFSSAPFPEIVLADYEEAFEDLLRKQFQLDSLKALEVYDKSPPALELESEFKRIRSL